MIIYTAKLDRRRLAAGGVAALVLVCALAVLLGFLDRGAASAAQLVSPKGVRTEADRLAYLGAYGWLVKEEPLAVEELLIPEEMGEEYADYLELQAGQGFDLAKYAGKRVKRYTYEILNYPTGETGVQASLLIYRNTVVGAEVLSPALDGFIHGLEMPRSETKDTMADSVMDVSPDVTTNEAVQDIS